MRKQERKLSKNPELTPSEQRALNWIDKFVERWSYIPSTWETARGLGYKSQQSTVKIYGALVRKGFLRRGAGGNKKAYSYNSAKHPSPMDRIKAKIAEAESILMRCFNKLSNPEVAVDLYIDTSNYFIRHKIELGG